MKQYNDRVINVKNVFKYIIHHFIFVIIFLILGAVGLAGICYLKNKSSVGLVQQENSTELKQAFENFSEEDKIDVSYAIYCHDRVEEMQQYILESPYMKLEPQHVAQQTFQYKVELLNEDEYTEAEQLELTQQIIVAYSVFVRDGGLSEKIVNDNLLSEEYQSNQIEPLFEFGYDATVETMSTFCFYIYGFDIIKDLDKVAVDVLTSYNDDATNLPKHKLVLLNHTSQASRNDTIYNNQKYMYSELTTLQDKLKTAVEALSADALNYYNEMTIIEGEETKVDSIQVASETDVKNLASDVPLKKILKYGILGAVLGILGACGVLCIKYMFSSTIIADSDYTLTMGMKLFGKISETNIEETIPFVIAKAKLACTKGKIEKLAIVSSDFDNIDEDIMKSLKHTLDKQGVDAIIIEDVLKNCDSMNQLFETGNCLVLEKTGISKYDKVYDLVMLCNENNINIIGVADVVK